MARRVLIVDDDDDFSTLLSDVFRQADYEVEREDTGRAALRRMEQGGFHLVVTDHRMPEMTGLEFVEALRKFDAISPVIVVSGYLDNPTIRRLIRNGVNGVFTKPLNIFSLLKKSDEVIQRAEELRRRIERGQSAGGDAELDFRFETFPCASHLSRQFARRVYTHRDFTKVMFLIGETGVPFAAIAREFSRLSGREEFVYDCHSSALEEELLLEMASQAQTRQLDQALLCILGAEAMTRDQEKILLRAWRGAGDEPDLAGVQWRFVICSERSPDDLYDEGRIGEELYLSGGINQLHVPPLRAMPEDVGHLAQRFLAESHPSLRLEPSSLVFLAKQRWKGNVDQLRDVILLAAEFAEGTAVRPSDLRAALDPSTERGAERISTTGPSLRRFLQHQRDDFLQAVYVLAGHNAHRASEALDFPPEMPAGATAAARENDTDHE